MQSQSRIVTVICLSIILIGCTVSSSAQGAGENAPSHNLAGPQSGSSYFRFPLTFEKNQGQTASGVQFLSHGKGYTAFLTANGMVLSLRPATAVNSASPRAAGSKSVPAPGATLEFRLVGANPNPAAVGEEPQPGRVNYFIGNDPTKWRTNIPTFGRIRYKNVYPGIDLVYYGNHRQLEYDFALAPGANANQIQFQIRGANKVSIDANGDLLLNTGRGELHFQSPVVYQESHGSRIPVSGGYALKDATHIGFQLAALDASKATVIDPALVFATYLGGSGDDQPTGIAVDGSGNVYVSGYTDSTDFPLANLGSLASASTHAFVAKLDATGSNLIYADYLGGNSQDYGYALTLDSANEVYITGSTGSSNFPVVNAYQQTYPGSFNAFVTHISADGSTLLYSTYFGGNGSDVPAGVALDASANILIAGNTSSTNLPTAAAYQSSVSANQGGVWGNYGFVTKFNASGSQLVYSTYLAGSSNVAFNCGGTPCWPSPTSAVLGIALDPSGNAYVAGNTNTYDFPVTDGAYLTTDTTQQDGIVGFVSKFSASGALDYSTYFYESSGLLTTINAIAADSTGSAYITGSAFSDGTFPITSTTICDPSVYTAACSYAFVTKFDATGATLLYSTFLGPNNYASPAAIALDASDDAYILGTSSSSSFGLVNGIEAYASGSSDAALIAEIDPTASTELFATFLGGSTNEAGAAMALDVNDNIYVTGTTVSTDFPVTLGAFQQISGGNTDAFIAKIEASTAAAVSVTPTTLQFASQSLGATSAAQTILLRNMGSAALSISSLVTTGNFAESDNCGTSVPAAGSCTLSVTFTPTGVGNLTGTIAIADDAAGSPHVIALSGASVGAIINLTPTTLSFTGTSVGATSSAQAITLANQGNTSLSIAGIAVSGSFAQTNNCGSSLAAGSSCTVNVTFKPTADGSQTGTITINDSVAGSPQTVSLTGNGADFTVASAPNSDTVNPGATATYALTVGAVGGYSSTVSLSCSGAPSEATCTVSPASVAPGSHTQPTVTITTTAGTSAELTPLPRPSSDRGTFALWMQFPGFGIFGLLFVSSDRRKNKAALIALVAILLCGMLMMTACAGGTGIAKQQQQGTPAGTYTVTVTGTSGSLQHSVPLTLIVQ